MVTIADYGGIKESIIASLPREAKIDRTLIPQEKENENAFYIRTPAFCITFYLDSHKCFAYALDGEYLGALERQDVKKLFSKFGRILKLWER